MPTSQKSAVTKGTILNISSNADVYERGERYYRDGKLISYNATEDLDGITTVRSSVEGNYKNYEVSLKLDSLGALSGYACSCESHSIWRGACKHVVAVLFAFAEGHARMFSAEKMRQHAKNLTENLEQTIFSGIDESFTPPAGENAESLLRLTPILHCGAKGVFLTFTVGRGRMYVIKSISGFVKAFKKNETVSYGQGLTFSHRRELFDETSRKLIDFISREDELYAEIAKRLSRQFQFTHHPLFSSRELFLTPRNTDEFFEIARDELIECVSDFAPQVILKDTYPSFGLGIRHLPGGTVVSAKDFSFRVIRGAKFFYFLTASGLNRTPKADGQILLSLLKGLDETPSREILFSNGEQSRFLAVVQPRLVKMGVVESVEGDSPQGEPAALAAKIFFDAEGRDISARLEFSYEDAAATRDVVGEYIVRRRLMSFGFAEEKKGFLLKSNDLIYAFLHGEFGIETLRDCAEIFISEDLQKKTIKQAAPKIGLRLSGNLLKVSLENSGYEIGELLEALDAYRTRKKFFRLKDGRFISLEDEPTSAAAGFLDTLDVSKKEVKGKSLAIPAYRALYVDELADKLAQTHALKRDVNFQKLLSHFKNNEALGFKTPKGLSGVLREYQKTGYKWLKTLAHYGFGGILADDMGLGKTLQIIALIASERGKGASIVVAPTSLLYNWENEIIKFAPQLKTQIVSGIAEKRRELLKTPNIDIFITTYDMLKRDLEFYEDMEFSYVIADEAQNIKNPATQAAKSVKELKGRVRFALTGTPIENTLTELWSIFDFIMPGYLYSAGRFSRVYETPIIKHNDTQVAAKLRAQIAPFVLRRVKKNVLRELPEKTETTLPADLAPEQKKIYQATLLEAIGAFDDIVATDSFADNRMRILAQLTRLRQICCHPSLFLEDYSGESGKLTLALETIQLALESGHRVLLFSQFTQMLSLIKDALATAKISNQRGLPVKYFYLDGATKAKERMEMTERFNAGENDLFLISLKAGGTGLNLTGADVVIHYDPWWNPSVMEQASDRAHRYGQEKSVHVYNIVAKDSIEEKIMSLQEKKRDLIDSVITEGGSFINLLTAEEVRRLFVG
jgi:SNF2 family DNA or RNA helicase